MVERFKKTAVIALVLAVVASGILGCCYLLNIIDQDGLKDTGAKVLGLIGILAVVSLAVSALTSSRNDS